MSAHESSVGFLGIGSHLPEEVRTNDWWPASIVAKWSQTAVDSRKRVEDALASATTDGQRRVLSAMLDVQSDPFRGVRERRVMPKGMRPSDMEVEAARVAIRRAGIDPKEIGFVLSASLLPDDVTIPNAFVVHQKLGLAADCTTLAVEGACNSFLLQTTLAEQMIAGRRARYGLLVQSCGISPVLTHEDAQCAWFGDGATAEVVGLVPKPFGILSQRTWTDSSLREAVMVGVPGKEWYEGPSILYGRDRASAYRILLSFADLGKQAIESTLAEAGHAAKEVDFFACHQAQIWQRTVVQEYAGLERARALDTFGWAGNVGSANIPLVLSVAEREGALRRGDLVSMYGGGAGVTWSGLVARWCAE